MRSVGTWVASGFGGINCPDRAGPPVTRKDLDVTSPQLLVGCRAHHARARRDEPVALARAPRARWVRPRPGRAAARRRLGLDPDHPLLLFPADPARPEKRHDRARRLAERAGVELLTYAGRHPDEVPDLVNAANAVLATSEREGFGLAPLEALACDVPVLATDVGVAPLVLRDVAGTLCESFELDRWLTA